MKKKDFVLYKRFRFPFINISKQQILEMTQKDNIDYILKKTWSCWFPNQDGTPCKKCEMCTYRII